MIVGRPFPQLALQVHIIGPGRRRLRQAVVVDEHGRFDWIEELRDVVIERVRFDVYAEWSDPRDWL